MTTTYLAYIPSPPRGVWHLGPLPIRAYAFFIITGIIVALLITDRRWAARGGQRGVVYDVALWMVPFGLIGGRLYHLATDWQTYWGPGGAGLGAALRIWDGGLGIWGAVALGVVGAWIGCRRHGIPLPAFIDAAAPGLVLAQAIGRLGNYFNQELYGRETTMPWGLEIFYRRDPAGYVDVHSLDGVSTGQVALVVQPTFLYELLWNLLVFGMLLLLDRRFSIGHGRLFASYVALYCVGRFGVELLRDDTATHIAGIRINTFTSTFVFIGAVVYIILAQKGREDPALLRGRGDDEDEEVPQPEPDEELAAVGAASAATAAAGSAVVGGDADVAEEPSAAESDEESEPEVTEAQAAVADAEADEGDVAETDDAEIVEEAEVEEADDAEALDLEDEPESVDEAEAVEEADEPVDDGTEPEAVEDEPEAEDVEADELAAEPQDVDAVDTVTEETEPEETEPAETEPAETEPAEIQPEGADTAESEAEQPAEPGVTAPEPVAEAAPATAKSGGHPLLGGGDAPVVAEGADEADEEAAELEEEADEATAAEAEAAEPVDEPGAEEEAGEPEPSEPEQGEPEAGDTESDVVESEPEPESESESVDAESDAVEPEAGVTESDLVEPESVDAESDAVEPEVEGEDEPALPSPTPDTPSEHAGTARQRWRLRLRRQRP